MCARELKTVSIRSLVWIVLLATPAVAEDLTELLETHATNKQRALKALQAASHMRGAWRQVLIDGPLGGVTKERFFEKARQDSPYRNALHALEDSHRRLFADGRNADLMVRWAGDPAFRRFGRHMSQGEAVACITGGDTVKVQAFQTIFETGQNTRGYVHKLECHGEAIEFIYAITDIVYGVMLPSDLTFESERVTADPARVRMFYVRAGEVIALHPYVLHSGSLSVEPDRGFAILIYKKPAGGSDRTVAMPQEWPGAKACIRIAGVDKFYLTLDELHTGDLEGNRGFILSKRPIRLPHWN